MTLSDFFALLPQSPAFYIIGFFATFLMAAAKGAFGGGLAIIGVPLLSLVVDPIAATIIVAPLVAFMDVFALRAFPPSTWSRPDLKWLSVGLVAGLAIGWLTFEWVDKRIVVLIIAVVTLGFTLRWFLKDRLNPPAPHGVLPARAVGLATFSGFTTFIAHSGGPPIAMYLLARNLDKSVYAGTTIAIFMLGNFLKLGPFIKMGLDQPSTLAGALVLSLIVPFGVWAGKYLHDRINQQQLFFWSYVLLAICGTKLLFDSVRAFM
ncbi:MAG: sulfite exporter TauE/SafE family protein [Beijerinckiaceae bacterium]